MKKIIFLFFCYSFLLNAMNRSRDVLGAPSLEFFTSFSNEYRELIDLFENPSVLSLPFLVPAIGHYQNAQTKAAGTTVGEYYNWRIRLGLIELSVEQRERIIPADIREVLRSHNIELKNVDAAINILGNFSEPREHPKGLAQNSCNIAFHPVICHWRNDGLKHFNEPIMAGVFYADGATAMPGGIAIGSLAPLAVNYHGALSPDNGRIRLNPDRGLITFWTVGIYKGHANVVFNIIANNEECENNLRGVTRVENIDGVIDVFNGMNRIVRGDDIRSLNQVLDIFGQLGLREMEGMSVVGEYDQEFQKVLKRSLDDKMPLTEEEDLARVLAYSRETLEADENLRRALALSSGEGTSEESLSDSGFVTPEIGDDDSYTLYTRAEQLAEMGDPAGAAYLLNQIVDVPDDLVEPILNLRDFIMLLD